MSENELDDIPEFDCGNPTGYHYSPEAESAVRAAMSGPSAIGINGTTQKLVASGTHYFNLKAFHAQYLKANLGLYPHSNRKVIDLGAEGVVLSPLCQATGICNGESAGEAPSVSGTVNYAVNGFGPLPCEYTAIMPYLVGRDLTMVARGDSGSCPSLSVQGYHDVGAMPVTCGGFDQLPPNGDKSQETQMIAMRDNPQIPQAWVDASATRKMRVFAPDNSDGGWEVADCISNFYPVLKGSQYQPRIVPSGVSPLYKFPRNGAHATYFEGWATLGGRLILFTCESWGNFPRVVVQTDDGPKTLFPGQRAVWADQFVPRCTDLWALSFPGSR